jgi:hypothetical protein
MPRYLVPAQDHRPGVHCSLVWRASATVAAILCLRLDAQALARQPEEDDTS